MDHTNSTTQGLRPKMRPIIVDISIRLKNRFLDINSERPSLHIYMVTEWSRIIQSEAMHKTINY